jgi:hypothetical protein
VVGAGKEDGTGTKVCREECRGDGDGSEVSMSITNAISTIRIQYVNCEPNENINKRKWKSKINQINTIT